MHTMFVSAGDEWQWTIGELYKNLQKIDFESLSHIRQLNVLSVLLMKGNLFKSPSSQKHVTSYSCSQIFEFEIV